MSASESANALMAWSSFPPSWELIPSPTECDTAKLVGADAADASVATGSAWGSSLLSNFQGPDAGCTATDGADPTLPSPSHAPLVRSRNVGATCN
eukprot:CAMPEP_0181324798 /NCGR_PEP_ID=MMETSP1101-20121128/20565_1 /TAXON_ID=46948 /ORGANISM="Rhodomonas abbreviata, Strain Caron Lab Isolate" /LENGTH=94 /DNA_ID=CAMNT_0023433025 /DNA_START=74 /DNA_END=358 /DNA_ORIENTATION=+